MALKAIIRHERLDELGKIKTQQWNSRGGEKICLFFQKGHVRLMDPKHNSTNCACKHLSTVVGLLAL